MCVANGLWIQKCRSGGSWVCIYFSPNSRYEYVPKIYGKRKAPSLKVAIALKVFEIFHEKPCTKFNSDFNFNPLAKLQFLL